ncbi:MAG: hypothetical protein ABW352_08090 [Polyangiales bacterium]
MADFPDKAPERDASMDASPGRPDAEVDARVREDAGPDATADAARDTGPSDVCTTNAQCDNDQLCCGAAGSMSCRDTDSNNCSACGVACEDKRAPFCGDRTCECVKGTNKGCDEGQRCSGTDDNAKCGDCATNSDCTGDLKFCVDAKCVACERGAMADSSADDVGCSGRTPICGPGNVCIGCDDSAPATECPGVTTCTPGLGCGGCKADAANIAVNGCTEGTPICIADASGMTTCGACTTNLQCKFPEGQGLCGAGRCSNKCDGDIPSGANGCADPALPICKAAAVPGGFDCQACAATDCAPGTFCATAGAKAGACVQCRTDVDCPQNGLVPVCDQTTFACRARTMTDCAATPATPFLDPITNTCVECADNTQCAANPKGPVCITATKTCGQCNTSAECPAATPTCNATTHVCEPGCTEQLCFANQAVAKYCNTAATSCVECVLSSSCTADVRKPLCNAAGTCVACAMVDTPNAACMAKIAGTRCFTANNSAPVNVGACGNCQPGQGDCLGAQTCNPASYLCQ